MPGDHHDLEQYLDEVVAKHFGGLADIRKISWRRRSRASTWKTLAIYFTEDRAIEVARELDRPDVPAWVIKFLIYHEVLHSLIPSVEGDDHPAIFLWAERRHPHFRRYSQWASEKRVAKIFASANR